MADSKYFTTTKKGEIWELRRELWSNKKTDAVKKIIACMTVGKDVSSLFPDVINCMQTDDVELKKLVYLYLINYAKTQPHHAIMAINTFLRDLDEPNPLLRALALRTMSCIEVDDITENLCEPLKKCLADMDPYVRKTAALCVAKVYAMDPDLAEEMDFLDSLSELLCDSNSMVIANAVAAMQEIHESCDTVWITTEILNKLLLALNECTEWGQVFILDALATYEVSSEREAQNIIERIIPRLAHANAAVVLSTVKNLMKLLDVIVENVEFTAHVLKKLTPALVTLLSSKFEIQYIALRNINLIIQKRPDFLKDEIRVFFVKYNDPIYVKLEKLDILLRLTSKSNFSQILSELKEYVAEVDVDFVRKVVRAIGRCAIKIESSSDLCVTALIELLDAKVNYVIQESVIVIKDIFRKYPNRYERIIANFAEKLDVLDEAEARESMIWIIGEYAEKIDNAIELLESFLQSFHDEDLQVKLQLLTAVVKTFLKRPNEAHLLVQQILSLCTEHSDHPDLRDRGLIYWRLLSIDPQAAKEVVFAPKPSISDEH